MKRILIIGNSPLPEENTKSRPAAGLRTWQFLKPLTREGGTVSVGADRAFSAVKRQGFIVKFISVAMPECYDEEVLYKETALSEKYAEILISKNDPHILKTLQKICDEFSPDAVIGVNTYPSFLASSLRFSAPFWADLNGWAMAEAQAQAYKMDSDDYLDHYYNMERSIVSRADKISVVSKPQEHALYGELAAFGRMNKDSFGYKFVEHIPNGTEWFEGERGLSDEIPSGLAETLGHVPKDAFMMLWMGGYNTWVDEITLFKGVSEAMKKNDKLYFVSTGGEISGLDNKTFAKFKELIEKSEFHSRFVFLGWVDTADIPYIYRRAHLGLNVDRKCAETIFGARNRLNEMMKFGLPIVTTLGSEISRECTNYGAGVGVKSGDYEGLASAISTIYREWYNGGRDSARLREYGARGREYTEKFCNYLTVCEPVFKWLENPRPAPDRGSAGGQRFGGETGIIFKVLGSSGSVFGLFKKFLRTSRGGVRYLKQNGLKKFSKKAWQKFLGKF